MLERDAAESIRLTYVAATRARDLLVVPVIGDQRLPGWVDVLHPALYPPRRQRRRPQPAPGCPAFGPDSLAARPARGPRSLDDAVAPGAAPARAGRPHRGLVGPECARPRPGGPGRPAPAGDPEERRGGRQQRRQHPRPRSVAAAPPRDHPPGRPSRPWSPARSPSTPATRPRRRPADLPVADRARWPAAGPPARTAAASARWCTPCWPRSRSTPRRPPSKRAAAVQGRYLGCPPRRGGGGRGARSPRRSATRCCAGRPLPRPPDAAAASCRWPCACADGTVLDGVVDLAFTEPASDAAGWWSTSRPTSASSGSRAAYEQQVRLYARAIAEATERPAQPVLLYV